MYDLDPRLVAVLATSTPVMVLRLTVLATDGSILATIAIPRQRIISGTASSQLRRDVRRSASLTLDNTDRTLAPAVVDDLFAQGARILVETGAFVGPDPVMVPLVEGFVTTVSAQMRGATVSLTVEGYLSACAQEAGVSLLLAKGTPLPTALHTLWDPVLPQATWSVEPQVGDRTLGANVPVLNTDSRLDVGLRISRDLGCEAFDGRTGHIVVRRRLDPTILPVDALLSDLIDLERAVDRPPVNAQAVEATPDDREPIYVVEEITDRQSPVHRDRIGLRMAPTIRSDAIPDPATARAAARAWLQGRAIAADVLTITQTATHPELDEGDIIEVTEGVTRTDGRYIIESIDYPLGPGPQSVTARSVLPLFITDLA